MADLTTSFSLLFHPPSLLPLDPPSTRYTTSPPLSAKILAYADDTLVYLQNETDFYRLQQVIDLYADASNASLNYSKTIAISLSGRVQLPWQQFLAAHNITAWHDRDSDTPLTYLGFPICSTLQQRNIAFHKLSESIRLATYNHSQRNLSIRGRATVLNTLIYSKLWHVMRVTTFTQAQLLSLRGIGSSFINFRIFPKLSFSTLSQPRHLGGLNILDPIIQQHALQWRWVCPLLLAACLSPLLTLYTVPSLPYLQHTLHWFFSSSDFTNYLYYFLFPSSRQSHWFPHRPEPAKAFLNFFSNFVSCLDNIPKSFDHCYIDPFTCLSLPFSEILQNSLHINHPNHSSFIAPDQLFAGQPGVKKLLALDVCTFDYDSQVLRVRDHSSNEFDRFPRLSRRVADWITQGQLFFRPFFMAQCLPAPRISINHHQAPNLSPIIYRTLFPSNHPTNLPFNSIQYYKKIIVSLITTPSSSTLTPSKWRSFWQLEIPLHARTIWYRCLHHKIPTKSTLHHIIPDKHPNPYCGLCPLSTPEDFNHFCFTCPSKLAVWRHIFNTYFVSFPMSDPDIISTLLQILTLSLHHITRPSHLPLQDLSIYQIFACTLLQIWQAHWRFVFDRTPFVVPNVFTSTTRSLSRLTAELQPDL